MNDGIGAGITIFAGRFGSGKTEVALNYALALAQHRSVPEEALPAGGQGQVQVHRRRASNEIVLVDLDIVTPYFRSREMAKSMVERGVEVISPAMVGQHLDTPAITPEILGAIQQASRPVVLDVGGDPQGARALGQFSGPLLQRGYTMHFVVNPYRPFTNTVDGLTRSIAEIEQCARLQVSSLVSNPNLIGETTARQIVDGHAQVEAFARQLNLPVAFVCVERRWSTEFGIALAGRGPLAPSRFAQPALVLDRHFVMSWE